MNRSNVTKISINALFPSEIDQQEHSCELAGVAVHLGPALAKRLSRLMKERDLNDREIGEKALVSRAAVYKLRHGDGNNAGINTVYNVAKVLGVPAYWLAYGPLDGAAIVDAVDRLADEERTKVLRTLIRSRLSPEECRRLLKQVSDDDA